MDVGVCMVLLLYWLMSLDDIVLIVLLVVH